MAVTEIVASSSYDGQISSEPAFVSNGSNIIIGNNGTYAFGGFFYFANVSIPPGATISSAKLQLRSYAALSGATCKAKIYLEDADSPSPPSSYADFNGRSLTSAVDWTLPSMSNATWYDSPDISSILQAVIDRLGWSENNTIGIQIRDDSSSSNAYRQLSSYDHLSTSYAPKLIFELAESASASDEMGAGDSADGYSLTVSDSDAAGAGDAIEGYDFKGEIADAAGAGDSVSVNVEASGVESDAAGLGDTVNVEIEAAFADIGGLGDSADAFNWTEWLDQNIGKAVARYYCTITGAADGEEDVEVPISSFQARKRNGYSTYLSVVIPGVAYADAISDRANGEIVIDMAYFIGGVESLREEILRADLEQINIYEGTTSRSITLIGHQEQTFVAKESRLYDPVYKQLVDGEKSFRFSVPDLWLNPGDTARVGDDAFTVDTVVYMVAGSGGQNVMEVQE